MNITGFGSFLATGVAVAALVAPAVAQAQDGSYRIAAQNLDGALREFGMQSGLLIAYTGDVVRGHKTAGVSGHLGAEAALQSLLRGSGLTYQRVPGGFAVVSASKPRLINTAVEQSAPAPVAQEAPSAPPETNEGGLNEIVVTATKRSDSAQRVPATIVAVDAEALQSQSIKSANDLVRIAPAIQFAPTRQNAITYIRGLGQAAAGVNVDPFSAINLNGANLPKEIAGSAFYDLERVEILYGPQGTLYGRNSLAGVINIFSKRPTFELSGEAMVEVGNYATLNAMGVINVPITDTLAARVAYNRQRHDGYSPSGAFDKDQDDVRLSILWEPSDRTSVLLLGSISNTRGFGDVLANNPALPCGEWCVPVDLRAVGQFVDVNVAIANLSIEHEISDSLSVTNVAAYNHAGGNVQLLSYTNEPFDPTSVMGAPQVENFSDELRFNYTSDRLKAVFGGYAFHTDSSLYSRVLSQNLGNISQVGPFFDKATGLAAFADVTYSVTDALRLIGGIRFSHDERELNGTNSRYTGGVPAVTQTYSNSLSADRVDFKAAIQYDIAPRSMVYATFQTGYNGGGFSSAPVTAGSTVAASYRPMTVKSGVLGVKNRFFDNRVQLNVEAFYNDYKDYQVGSRNASTGQNTIYNAEQARTWGVQVDTRFQISPDDELGIAVDYLRAKADKLVIPVAPFTNYSGLELPFAPEFSAHLDYRHTFHLANDAKIEFQANSRFQTKIWTLYTHAPASEQDAYSMTDATLTYRAPSGNWSLTAWIKNIEDTYTFGASASGIPGPLVSQPFPPRTYGLRATANF